MPGGRMYFLAVCCAQSVKQSNASASALDLWCAWVNGSVVLRAQARARESGFGCSDTGRRMV